MGVTVLCWKTRRSIDLGYFGFKRLRDKVAELYGGVFWDHYQGIDKAPNPREKGFCKNSGFSASTGRWR